MGYGKFYRDLKKMEGRPATITFANKKPSVNGVIQSINLEDRDGLYVMVELRNGQWKLFTPKYQIKDIIFKPEPINPNDTPESLAGDIG